MAIETACFTLYLFGRFSLLHQEEPISNFRGDKVRALLAYLALQQGRPVLRQQLITLLWNGYTPASAKMSLRVALSNLRQILAPLEVLKNGRQTVQLQVDRTDWWCDAVELAELLAPNHVRPLDERWGEIRRLYYGEFLPGFETIDSQPFQIWLQAQRDHYRQQMEQRRSAFATSFSLPTNMVRTLTPLIGRQSEIQKVRYLLAHADYSLITIVGEGGVGKTRLVQAVAQSMLESSSADDVARSKRPTALADHQQLTQQFTDGIWFVSLTNIVAHEQVDDQLAAAIGTALRIAFYRTESLAAQLIDYVREKALLLILDNFEHLISGAAFLVTLLQEAPNLKLLITSRQQLGLQAEHLFRLQGLPVGDETMERETDTSAKHRERIQTLPSVQLFRERARRVATHFRPNQHTYADIAAICRLVDGLPLAIELAAAQVAQLSCAEIRRTLVANYAALTTNLNDVPARHRNLRQVLDDSWRLLSLPEAYGLMQCVVFQDGFTVSAAVAITGTKPEIMERLVQKSWLRTNQSERYLLHELVRQYATAQLQGLDRELETATALRHSEYYLALASGQEAVLCGPTPQAATALIRQELMNIQAAWRWAIAHGQWQWAAQASAALANFYQMAGLVQRGEAEFALAVNALQTALAQAPSMLTAELEWALAKFLCAHAQMLLYLGNDEEAIHASEQVIALAQSNQFPAFVALAREHLGRAFTRQGRLAQAREQLEMALPKARTHAPQTTLITTLYELGNLAFIEAHYPEAVTWCEEALAASRVQHYAVAEAKTLRRLAAAAYALGNYAQAIQYCETALQLAQQIGAHDMEEALFGNLGIIWATRGDYATARHYFTLGLNASRKSGNRVTQVNTLCNLGSLLSRIGDYRGAFAYTQQSIQLMQLSGFEEELATALTNLALHAYSLKDYQAAKRYTEQGLQSSQQLQNINNENIAWKILGHALVGLGQLDEAAAAYTHSLTLARTLALPYSTSEALAGLVEVGLAQGKPQPVVMEYVEELLTLLAKAPVYRHDEPFDIYLTCYQALVAYQDPRAATLLQEAYQQLQARAALISDEGMRHSFLTQIAAHQKLVTLYERDRAEHQ